MSCDYKKHRDEYQQICKRFMQWTNPSPKMGCLHFSGCKWGECTSKTGSRSGSRCGDFTTKEKCEDNKNTNLCEWKECSQGEEDPSPKCKDDLTWVECEWPGYIPYESNQEKCTTWCTQHGWDGYSQGNQTGKNGCVNNSRDDAVVR